MIQTSPGTGVFAVPWAHVMIDNCSGLGPDWLQVGARWTWDAKCLRLDRAESVITLQAPSGHLSLNTRARRIAERLCGEVHLPAAQDDLPSAPANGFVLTDGLTVYYARLVQLDAEWIAVFAGALPAQGQPCWVTATALEAVMRPSRPRQEVICFSDDAVIATPQGPRPIALLQVGDCVTTRDNGPQPVRWIGQTTVSGHALRQHPHLRPIRLRRDALNEGLPDEDLRVSPAHRILVCGAKARALFGCDEVLARACDLVDYVTIAPDMALHGVTYVHLLFDAHQIIFANGLPTESFHPAHAPDQTLRQHRQALARIAPDLATQPSRYGPTARRYLSQGEAALLAA